MEYKHLKNKKQFEGCKDFETFKLYAGKVFGNKYEYLEYNWNKRKVAFKMIETERVYTQLIFEHLKGFITIQERMDTAFDGVIKKHQEMYPGEYIYSDYKGYRHKMKLTDVKTGAEYWQWPAHVAAGNLPRQKQVIWNEENFISYCSKIHNNRFKYENYKGITKKVDVIDVKTGIRYIQNANHHLKGSVPKDLSRKSTSSLELYIREIVLNMFPYEKVEFGKRYKFLNNKSIDIYFPNLKLGIECNGIAYHHSSKTDDVRNFLNKIAKSEDYHINKSKLCLANGIKLIHIFDFEIYNGIDLKSIVNNYLENKILDFENSLKKINLKTFKENNSGLDVYIPIPIFRARQDSDILNESRCIGES